MAHRVSSATRRKFARQDLKSVLLLSAAVFGLSAEPSAGQVLTLSHDTTVTDIAQYRHVELGPYTLTAQIGNDQTFQDPDGIYGILISGRGSLVKMGAGTLTISSTTHWTQYLDQDGGTTISAGKLILTGALKATGPIINSNAGTLQIGDGTQTISVLTGSIINNGVLVSNTAGGNSIYADISGSGSFVVSGGGSTSLYGRVSHTGGTTITDGTLALGAGSAWLAGDIVNNGRLYYDGTLYHGDDAFRSTYNGVISGTGRVEVFAGIVTFTNANTYTGGTTIRFGGLVIGDGGTSGSIAGDVSVGPSGVLVINRADTIRFDGNVTGAGTVRQTGTGTTILTGVDQTSLTAVHGVLQFSLSPSAGTYTGTLEVDANAHLIADIAGTMTCQCGMRGSGDFVVQGGTLVFKSAYPYDFSGTTTVKSGAVFVFDKAGLGGNMIVQAGAQLIGVGGPDSLSNSGTVSPGSATGEGGRLSVANYKQFNGGTLQVHLTPTSSTGLQANVASLDGTLSLVFDSGEYTTTDRQILTAGKITGSFANVTLSGQQPNVAFGWRQSAAGVDVVLERKGEMRILDSVMSSSLDQAAVFADAVSNHQEVRYCAHTGAPSSALPSCPELSVWRQAVGGFGSRSNSGDLVQMNSHFGGAIAGVDVETGLSGLVMGATVGYSRGDTRTSGGAGRITSDFISAGLNAAIPLLSGSLNGNVQWLYTKNVIHRDVALDGGNTGTYVSRPISLTMAGAVSYSRSIYFEDISAIGRLGYIGVDQDPIRETGTSVFALRSDANSSYRVIGDLGIRLSHVFKLNSGTMLIPDVSIGGRWLVGSDGERMLLNFADAQGPSFYGDHLGPDRASFIASVGITAMKKKGVSLYLRGNGQLGSTSRMGWITLGGSFPL